MGGIIWSGNMPQTPGIIILRGIRAEVHIKPDAWGRDSKTQPTIVSLELEPPKPLEQAARADDVSETLDYGKVYKKLSQHLIETYAVGVCELAFQIKDQIAQNARSYKIDIHLPKASLRASGGLFYVLRHAQAPTPGGADTSIWIQTLRISGIRCACIVGINPHERIHKQAVDVELEFELITPEVAGGDFDQDAFPQWHNLMTDYSALVSAVAERVEGSDFQTIEALASAIAQTVTMDFGHDAVSVRLEKPSAIANIDAAGVRIHRRQSFFANADFWKVKRP